MDTVCTEFFSNLKAFADSFPLRGGHAQEGAERRPRQLRPLLRALPGPSLSSLGCRRLRECLVPGHGRARVSAVSLWWSGMGGGRVVWKDSGSTCSTVVCSIAGWPGSLHGKPPEGIHGTSVSFV
jgi:hypothetical protein